MAGRSESVMIQDEDLGAEAQLTRTAEILAKAHAGAVGDIVKRDDLASTEGMKLILDAAKAGCGIGAFLATGRKLVAELDALTTAASAPAKAKTRVLGSAPVNGVTNEEMEMDDDSGRTPERVAEIHADIGRRLELARRSREQKSVAQDGAVPADRALPGGVQAGGATSEPAA
jgi:hypothetical protein